MIYTVLNLPIEGTPEEGDKVMLPNGEIAEVITEYGDRFKGCKLFRPHLVYQEFNQQKIFGLVSPKATWVEVGMKFKEDQVKFHKTEFLNKNMVSYYLIKCPCGRFH